MDAPGGVAVSAPNLALVALVAALRTVIDLAAPRTITGEVVWQEVWRSAKQNDNTVPLL
jgi:hypothetical protein